jgi:hypothetical protein
MKLRNMDVVAAMLWIYVWSMVLSAKVTSMSEVASGHNFVNNISRKICPRNHVPENGPSTVQVCIMYGRSGPDIVHNERDATKQPDESRYRRDKTRR